MTTIIATGTVMLPFNLNVCALGPSVEPIFAHVEDADVRIYFPASLTDGSVGKSLYPSGWAWWTIDRLLIESSAGAEDLYATYGEDTERIRGVLLSAAQAACRRLLNSYRWRMQQFDVHPVLLDPALFRLQIEHADSTRDELPEPVASFFYNRMPEEPPLDKSINGQTIMMLQNDILEGIEPPHEELLELDILWLESIGEIKRATEMRAMGHHETVYRSGY